MRKAIKIFLLAACGLTSLLVLAAFVTLTRFYFNFMGDLEKDSSRGSHVNFTAIPEVVVNAIAAAEDPNFFSCRKLTSICSLSFQVARGVTPDRQYRTIERHIYDLVGVFAIQFKYSHQEIFEQFANRVYVGEGKYGLQDGAVTYFSKDLSALGLKEAAMLAGILKAPSIFSPKKSEVRALARRDVVLNKMVELKMIKKADIDAAEDRHE